MLVIGAGMMGRAAAYDLARSAGVHHVTLADVDHKQAESAAALIPHGTVIPVGIDVQDEEALLQLMRTHACAVSAVPFRFNELLTRTAIKSGTHLCDLGGNDEVVRRQKALHDEAIRAGVTIVPNCGLAPGLANIIAAQASEQYTSVEHLRLRVGGLPVHPVPPFNYQLVFSVEGLVNEYSGNATILRDGRVEHVEAMTGLESIEFPKPFGVLEAFHTSGGASELPTMLEGRVKNLDYKTIRYPGHCERMKVLLEAGFASDELVQTGANIFTEREVFFELLRRKLPTAGPDVVLLRIEILGEFGGTQRREVFEMIDFSDESANITAMMRCTAFPTSLIALYLAQDVIRTRGVLTPECCVPLNTLLNDLALRGIRIRRTGL